ncbi:AraC family transcriptional regulator [Colwellia sp. Bg11-12]|nr:AraC family transcriptional regulator [Colwellia sp. Bg11-12]
MGVKQLIRMFDLLPDVLFWIKDNSHNFIHANQAFIEHKGVKGIEKIIGKTDYDFSPAHIAEQFIRDDEKVLAGKNVTERLEMNMTQSGDTAWYATSKRAITNENGDTIGTYGITRHLEKQAKALSNVDAVKEPVDYIRQNFKHPFTIEELAEVAYLSVSALERRFKKYLAKTPKQFINEVRLENARKLLIETNMPISQVGDETGFSDHSYFSKQFRLFFGELPSDFRRNYYNNP